jgi:hypothetical protein
MLGRYEYLYHTRHAKITFLVAVVENEIAGYLIYKTPPGEEEPEEWNPTFPDGTNSKFFELIFGKLKVSRAQYNLKNHWGTCLASLFIFCENRCRKDTNSYYRAGESCS